MSLKKSLERLEDLTKKMGQMVNAEGTGSSETAGGVASLTMSDKKKIKKKAMKKAEKAVMAYHAGKASSPHKPPSYKSIKAKSGPMGPVNDTQKSEMEKAKVDTKLSPSGVKSRRQAYWQGKVTGAEHTGVHEPSGWKSGQSTLGQKVSRASATYATPQASGSSYGHISDAKQRAKEQARGTAKQKLREQREMKKPKLPGSKSSSVLDPSMGRMRNMVHSFRSFKKSYEENRKPE